MGDPLNNNYYAASANAWETKAPLHGMTTCELLVVGGGFTGLAAALAAREQGLCVILLEAQNIGFGASGRNGGQLIPGLRWSMREIDAKFGRERAQAIFDLAWSAGDRVQCRIDRHAIQCDLKAGHLEAAYKPSHFDAMCRDTEFLERQFGWDSASIVPQPEMADHIDGGDYHGGIYDKAGGHFHPLNYALGLAQAAAKAGVHIYEQSRVAKIIKATSAAANPSRNGWQAGERAKVVTSSGAEIMANKVILATDAWMGWLEPSLDASTVAIMNYNIATQILPYADSLLPSDAAIADSRFVLNYFRLSADKRLIFGGGEKYVQRPPSDIAAFVRRHLTHVFPSLSGVAIDYAWGGTVGVTMNRLPHIGRLGKTGDVYFAHGFSGHGALVSTLAGELMVDAIMGAESGFDVFANLPHRPFPGGALFAQPLATLGLLWYALRDRL
jgi:gamma-glutamylputrescine oxidase